MTLLYVWAGLQIVTLVAVYAAIRRACALIAAGAERTRWLALFLLLAAAGAVLYTPPYYASDLSIVPDSVEYAAGAQRFVREHRYDLPISPDRVLPVRYPPWFSVGALAPFALFGGDIENSIFLIFTASLCVVLGVFALGCRDAGTAGGVLAGLLVLVLPAFRYFSAQILIDLPFTAAFVLAMVIFAATRDAPRDRSTTFEWTTGILAAAAGAWRITGFALLLPLLIEALRSGTPRRAARCAALLLPPCVTVLVTAIYNYRTFDSVMRNGYHFWCPVPYDFFGLTFSLNYFFGSAADLLDIESGIPFFLVAAAAALLLRKGAGPYLRFALWASGPLLILHLFYYYPSPRFVLPCAVLLAPVAALGIAALLEKAEVSRAALRVLFACALLCAFLVPVMRTRALPLRRIAADALKNIPPGDAVVVAAIDPVYLSIYAGSSHRFHFVPISRRVEYGSKRLPGAEIGEPPPRPESPHSRRLLCDAPGGAWAIPEVPENGSAEQLKTLISSTGAGYLLAHGATAEEIDSLRRSFAITELDGGIFRLTPRSGV